MKFGEIIPHIRKVMWVRRAAWHPEYAIKLCNVNTDGTWDKKQSSVFFTSTLDLFYHLGMSSAPLKGENLNENDYRHQHYGLNHDIFCGDWEVANQDKCETVLNRSIKERENWLRKMDEARLRVFNTIEKVTTTETIVNPQIELDEEDYPLCQDCADMDCDDCPVMRKEKR
jgi:hypothetical protein